MSNIFFEELDASAKIKHLKELKGKTIRIVLMEDYRNKSLGVIAAVEGILKEVPDRNPNSSLVILKNVSLFDRAELSFVLKPFKEFSEFDLALSVIKCVQFQNSFWCENCNSSRQVNGKQFGKPCMYQLPSK